VKKEVNEVKELEEAEDEDGMERGCSTASSVTE
jgi:hypothetical protein